LGRGIVTERTHLCHSEQVDGSSQKERELPKPPPAKFSPELLMLMRSALNTAVHRIDRSHRTPATKAKMAQRIVRTASEGVTDLHALTSAAVDEGSVPSA
jgi:hypothetical protein